MIFVILSILVWIAAIAMLRRRPLLSPALSYLGLLSASFAQTDGNPWFPLNSVILMGWLCMTIVVMLATLMQPAAVRRSTHGVWYMTGGAFVGMVIGLLGITFTQVAAMLYGIMVTATAAGVFFGFLMYSRTPGGSGMSIGSGNFFHYLLAKGFPVAITVMQIGVVLTILVLLHAPAQ
ncbi:MAG: hypothetical protein NC328_07720 [Muribaculum sp.]|nr:hypothetical protein [Muribaculum sp.]